jgi:hypothetical protein
MKNRLSVSGFFAGIVASISTLIVCYDFMVGDAFRGLDFLLILMILLPALFALISSFVAVPLILISFVWALPFSLYLWMSSGVMWFAASCFAYLVSAYLKYLGTRDKALLS